MSTSGKALPRRRNREGIPYPLILKTRSSYQQSANTAQTRTLSCEPY